MNSIIKTMIMQVTFLIWVIASAIFTIAEFYGYFLGWFVGLFLIRYFIYELELWPDKFTVDDQRREAEKEARTLQYPHSMI